MCMHTQLMSQLSNILTQGENSREILICRKHVFNTPVIIASSMITEVDTTELHLQSFVLGIRQLNPVF